MTQGSSWKGIGIERKRRRMLAGLGLLVASGILFPGGECEARSSRLEISFGFSYNRTNYSETSFSWTRRWGASLGYHLTELTEIELGFQDVWDRNQIIGYEDTTFHDQIYSINWVQSFVGRAYPIQPYLKGGVGQLNREAQGTFGNGASPPAILDSVTGIAGVGMRIYLTRNFAIRSEFTSFIAGGRISTWRDNLSYTLGGSFFF